MLLNQQKVNKTEINLILVVTILLPFVYKLYLNSEKHHNKIKIMSINADVKYWTEIDWYIKESADKLKEILIEEEKQRNKENEKFPAKSVDAKLPDNYIIPEFIPKAQRSGTENVTSSPSSRVPQPEVNIQSQQQANESLPRDVTPQQQQVNMVAMHPNINQPPPNMQPAYYPHHLPPPPHYIPVNIPPPSIPPTQQMSQMQISGSPMYNPYQQPPIPSYHGNQYVNYHGNQQNGYQQMGYVPTIIPPPTYDPNTQSMRYPAVFDSNQVGYHQQQVVYLPSNQVVYQQPPPNYQPQVSYQPPSSNIPNNQ